MRKLILGLVSFLFAGNALAAGPQGPFVEAGAGVLPATYSLIASGLYASWYDETIEALCGKGSIGYGLGDWSLLWSHHDYFTADGMTAGDRQEEVVVDALAVRYHIVGSRFYVEAGLATAQETDSATSVIYDRSRAAGDRWRKDRVTTKSRTRGFTIATGARAFDFDLKSAGRLGLGMELAATYVPLKHPRDAKLVGATNVTATWSLK